MLKAGFIEESLKSSDYCSRAFFVAKPNCDNLKARMVSDFSELNRILGGYTVLPQGSSSSCDIFNIMTDRRLGRIDLFSKANKLFCGQ